MNSAGNEQPSSKTWSTSKTRSASTSSEMKLWRPWPQPHILKDLAPRTLENLAISLLRSSKLQARHLPQVSKLEAFPGQLQKGLHFILLMQSNAVGPQEKQRRLLSFLIFSSQRRDDNSSHLRPVLSLGRSKAQSKALHLSAQEAQGHGRRGAHLQRKASCVCLHHQDTSRHHLFIPNISKFT